MSAKIHAIVAEKIVEALKAGVPPWRKPYSGTGGVPLRFTGRWTTPYRGINMFVLWAMGMQYEHSLWITARQAKSIGANVKRGQYGKYAPVMFYKRVPDRDDPEKFFPMLRFYKVYNIGQVEGIPEALLPAATEVKPWERIESAELMLELMKESGREPQIATGPKPCYMPAVDIIEMPQKSDFTDSGEYYSTLFHEIIHWTGHDTRLSRELKGRTQRVEYSREELIAEMGSAIIGAACGLEPRVLENSAAYIEQWSQYIKKKENHRHVFEAARHAQAAATFLCGGEWTMECETCHAPLTSLKNRLRGLCSAHLEEEDQMADSQAERIAHAERGF